ncbi:MAG: hypothetical protein ABIP97_02440, partial [Chthoniobacterales bacterium]
NAQDALEVLKRFVQSPITQAVQIKYQFKDSYTPNVANKAEINRKVDSYRKQLETVDADNRDELIISYRNLLEKKSENTRDCLLVIGPDFYANYFPGNLPIPSGGDIWEIRRGSLLYRYIDKQLLTIASDPDKRTRYYHDLAFDSIGQFGNLPPDIIRELSNGKGEIYSAQEHEKFTLKKGSLTVVFSNNKSDNMRLESIVRDLPRIPQKDTWLFENYRDVNRVSIPFKVTTTFDETSGHGMNIYIIKDIKFGDDYTVPLINQELGFTQVNDRRYKPVLDYFILKTLPTDAQIAEWVKDPGALKKHNDSLQRLKMANRVVQ